MGVIFEGVLGWMTFLVVWTIAVALYQRRRDLRFWRGGTAGIVFLTVFVLFVFNWLPTWTKGSAPIRVRSTTTFRQSNSSAGTTRSAAKSAPTTSFQTTTTASSRDSPIALAADPVCRSDKPSRLRNLGAHLRAVGDGEVLSQAITAGTTP